MANSSSRQQIIELLDLLRSEEEQLEYERNVPHVDITNELLCMWFDDQYNPKFRDFDSCFTREELAALAEFHQFYDERVSKLPSSQGTVRTWLASPVWREVMQKAEYTLARLSGRGDR